MSLKVDPAMLRRFGDAVSGVSESIAGLDVSSPFADSQQALPGTQFSVVCADGFEATTAALRNVCSRLVTISNIAHGTANDYEVAEADFTAKLHVMDVPS
ncbi:hypothetical protein BTZ20_4118 [Rhodococcus sp. MTM3W5.2]|uniref:hypothetical protein n=1 Tax=Rhodococcus sp. MTM3W5.2 TaxID=1805827 RepID=UPI000979091D|nr:hypothetical protein [Rhodococcus sp. MTM3W5.2]AQA21035.1 hypothetical protein BTZ20_4118 [Rhodococcus sp. MTM3W5.2]